MRYLNLLFVPVVILAMAFFFLPVGAGDIFVKLRGRTVMTLLVGISLIAAGALIVIAGREHRLALRREIPTSLSAGALWNHLEAAFRDSATSPLWPNELETLRSPGLATGAQVTATYKTPFGASTHTYTIGQCSPGQGFTYLTGPEHPLQGGGRVLLQPTAKGTTLVWSVDYTYRGVSLSALFVRFYFVPRFFARLEANLRALE